MKRVVSILICLAMLVSGVCFAEQTAVETPEVKSATAVISDIVVKVNGADYALNPQLILGVQTEGESALLDFGVLSEGEKLLPIQLKLDETGAALNIGDSRTAYVLPMDLVKEEMEYIGLDEYKLGKWIGAYAALIEESMNLRSSATVMTQEESDALLEKCGVKFKEKEVTAEIGGVEQPAVQRTYRLSHEQMMQLVDEALAYVSGDYMQAYMNYMNATMALTGTEMDPADLSYSAIMAELPVTLSMHVDETFNADGAGFGMIKVFVTVTERVGEEGRISKYVIPVSYTAEDADTMTMKTDFSMDIEGEMLDLAMTADVDGLSSDVAMTMKVGETASFDIAVDNQVAEDGSSSMDMRYDILAEGVSVNLEIGSATAADGLTNADFALDVMGLYGLSCHVATGNEPIEDRVAAAVPMSFTELSEEDPAFMRMTLAAVGLAGDVEILWSDESVSALVDVFMEMFGYGESYYEDYAYTDVYEYDEYGYDGYTYEEYPAEPQPDFNPAISSGERRQWT